jgi:hypothetical protein
MTALKLDFEQAIKIGTLHAESFTRYRGQCLPDTDTQTLWKQTHCAAIQSDSNAMSATGAVFEYLDEDARLAIDDT